MSENLVQQEPRTLSKDLPPVGPIAFGLWRYTTDKLDEATKLLETAIELGMNLIDNADVYGFDWGGEGFGACEELLGQVLTTSPHLRDQIVLSTKGGIAPPIPYDSSQKYLRSACEESLRRLQVEQIDLYQIHRPDIYTHPSEVAQTLDSLVAEGKIKTVGVSNHTPEQVSALSNYLQSPLVTTQPEFSVNCLTPLRDGTFDQCSSENITPLAWSPLAGGKLATGEGVRVELLELLDEIAERESADRAAVAIAFVLAHPTKPVAIVGTQQTSRLKKIAKAVEVSLNRDDVYNLIEASDGVPLP
ncbi:MAG: aldo/keto reductase [Actinomycetota bacterium]|nr:aldo/keto reductase [Dehalococcoidia bacterium]MEC7909023.1 aldo/keto reductase [Actinomycetota bacterium]